VLSGARALAPMLTVTEPCGNDTLATALRIRSARMHAPSRAVVGKITANSSPGHSGQENRSDEHSGVPELRLLAPRHPPDDQRSR